MATFQIDIVWRWAGIATQAKLKKAAALDISSHVFPEYTNDLKFSMRSIAKYCNWYRQAFLIVDDDELLPSFLRVINQKLKIVRHSEFIPNAYMPTYNSNVIDSFIHRIPDLAEHFIVLDDDCFVCKAVTPSTFFNLSTKKPNNRHYEGKDRHSLRRHKYMYVQMWQKAIKEYGIKYTRLQHQAQPYTKSLLCSYANTTFKQGLQEMISHHVRTFGDINVLRFTTGLSSTNGDAYMIRTPSSDEHFYEGESFSEEDIAKIMQERPTFLCINNTHESMTNVYKLLTRIFPHRSPFEK